LGWASWADLFPLLIALPTLAVKFADAIDAASRYPRGFLLD